jgi:hypothetical protein
MTRALPFIKEVRERTDKTKSKAKNKTQKLTQTRKTYNRAVTDSGSGTLRPRQPTKKEQTKLLPYIAKARR